MSHYAILDNIKALDFVNFQLAELKTIKQKLEAEIVELLDHKKEGAKTYEINKYKLTVEVDTEYKVNKAEYEIYKNQISPEFNPIYEVIDYKVNAKVRRVAEEYASAEEMNTLLKFITKKTGKPRLKITSNA